jgi:transcriptional regulator with XRE-family HTH domain
MGNLPRFDVDKLQGDLAVIGWLPVDLARAAGVSKMTVSRVLSRKRSNPRTWDALARALGHTNRRYLIAPKKRVA